MATQADQAVTYQSPLADIIKSIAGNRTSGSNNTTGSTTGSTAGTTSGTTTSTSTADLGALNQIFNQASAGMSPEQLSALISSIFTEGANQVPSLIGAYANATGSRATGNSGTKLALDELNKSMSTQAVQALLNFNQGSQQTAANAASNIAANTRQQSQQQTQQQQQQQTGTSQQQQTQQQASTINPKSSSMLATLLGGASLANKFGLLPSFGKGAVAPSAGAASSPGTISGGGSLVGNTGSATVPMLTNGGGTSGMLSTPTASSGFLQGPVAANPYGGSSVMAGGGGGGNGAGGGVPNYDFGGGVTGLGGFAGANGLLGSAADLTFGALPSSFNAFGTLGTDSLGSNLSFGSNPFNYGGDAGGITGIVGNAGSGGLLGSIGDTLGGWGTGIGDALGSATDWLGSLWADGGQVQTGGAGPARVRNQNYLGPQLGKDRAAAMNYEGYAPTAAVGASQPAGGSPTMAAVSAPMTVAPTVAAISQGDAQAQARQQYAASVEAANALARMFQGQTGGSGGVGEGGAPGQNEADNGAAGIGPSGVSAAPNGVTQGINAALGLSGFSLGIPGLNPLSIIAMMAAAVNAANQGYASSVGGDSTGDDGVVGTVSIGGLTDAAGNDAGGVGSSGGPGSGGDGGPGDSGVGGDSAGDGSSGSAGTSAGGDGWADGGIVFGAGTGTSDSIKVQPKQPGGKNIRYSDGEYVIPKDVVDALGPKTFDDLCAAFHMPVNR